MPDQSAAGVRTVAHCATPFLPLFTPWLYAQIRHQYRYRTVVLTQEERNREAFPVDRLHSTESLGPVRSLCNRVIRAATGMYPYYSQYLRAEAADIIHAHFGYQGFRCLRAKSKTGLPLVTSFYGADATRDSQHSPWRRRFERLFSAGELFLAEGGHMVRRLERAGCPPERIVLHHLGVDVEGIRFSERRPADDGIRVLICANFRQKKGVPTGLRALGKALEGLSIDCRVVVIGDGPERPRVLEAITKSGLSDRVDLIGLKPYAAVLQYMESCHLILQASMTADDGDAEGGAPVALLDAQATGLPVVATAHDDIPEYVVDGQSGLLAAEGDVDGLADRLRNLLRAPERWPAMGRHGRRHVEEFYNARVQAAGLESIYDGLM